MRTSDQQSSTIIGKSSLIAFALVIVVAFFYFDLSKFLSFEHLKSSQHQMQVFYLDHQLETLAGYFFLYVLVTAFSLPGAAVMTLAGGMLFGFWRAAVIVSFASTLGATLSFLTARFLLREFVMSKFGEKLSAFNQGFARDGEFYLFTLRLIPIFPFFIVNLVMGLTPIKTLNFAIVSQLGMIPGTLVFANAGTQLGSIERISDIMSPGLLGSFALLGLFPIVAKKLMAIVRNRHSRGTAD